MLKRREVLVMMTIAMVSFLIGSTFSVITTAKDQGGNPFDKIWKAIDDLEDRVDSVECCNKTGFLNTPAYDSGWISTEGEEEIVFNHNLNTTEVFVYMIGKDADQDYKIHQYEYGGRSWAYWHKLDSNNISVTADYPWDYVRVMIWRIPEPPD